MCAYIFVTYVIYVIYMYFPKYIYVVYVIPNLKLFSAGGLV